MEFHRVFRLFVLFALPIVGPRVGANLPIVAVDPDVQQRKQSAELAKRRQEFKKQNNLLPAPEKVGIFNKNPEKNDETAKHVDNYFKRRDVPVPGFVEERLAVGLLSQNPLFEEVIEKRNVFSLGYRIEFDGASRKTRVASELHDSRAGASDHGAKWLVMRAALNFWVRENDRWREGELEIETPTVLKPHGGEQNEVLDSVPDNFLMADTVYNAIDGDRLKRVLSNSPKTNMIFTVTDSGATENAHWFLINGLAPLIVWPVFCRIHMAAHGLRETVEAYLSEFSISQDDWVLSLWTKMVKSRENAMSILSQVDQFLEKEPITETTGLPKQNEIDLAEEFQEVLESLSQRTHEEEVAQLKGLAISFADPPQMVYRGRFPIKQVRRAVLRFFKNWSMPNWARWLTYFSTVTTLLETLLLRFGWVLGFVPEHGLAGRIGRTRTVFHMYFTHLIARPIVHYSRAALCSARTNSVIETMARFDHDVAGIIAELERGVKPGTAAWRDLTHIFAGSDVDLNDSETQEILAACVTAALLALHCSRTIMRARCGTNREAHWKWLDSYLVNPVSAVQDLLVPGRLQPASQHDPGSQTLHVLAEKVRLIYQKNGENQFAMERVFEYLDEICRLINSQDITTRTTERKVGSVKRIQDSSNPRGIKRLCRVNIRAAYIANRNAVYAMYACLMKILKLAGDDALRKELIKTVVGPKRKRRKISSKDTQSQESQHTQETKPRPMAKGRPRRDSIVMFEAERTARANAEKARTEMVEVDHESEGSPSDYSDSELLPSKAVLEIQRNYYLKREKLAKSWWSVQSAKDDQLTFSQACIRGMQPINLRFDGLTIDQAFSEPIATRLCDIHAARIETRTKAKAKARREHEAKAKQALTAANCYEGSRYDVGQKDEKPKRQQKKGMKKAAAKSSTDIVPVPPPAPPSPLDRDTHLHHLVVEFESDGNEVDAFQGRNLAGNPLVTDENGFPIEDVQNNDLVANAGGIEKQRGYYFCAWYCAHSMQKEVGLLELKRQGESYVITGKTVESRRAGPESVFTFNLARVYAAQSTSVNGLPGFILASVLDGSAIVHNPELRERLTEMKAVIIKNPEPGSKFEQLWTRLTHHYKNKEKASEFAIQVSNELDRREALSKEQLATMERTTKALAELGDEMQVVITTDGNASGSDPPAEKPRLLKSAWEQFDDSLPKFGSDASKLIHISGKDGCSGWTEREKGYAVDRLKGTVCADLKTSVCEVVDFYGVTMTQKADLRTEKYRSFQPESFEDICWAQNFLIAWATRCDMVCKALPTAAKNNGHTGGTLLGDPTTSAAAASSSSSSSSAAATSIVSGNVAPVAAPTVLELPSQHYNVADLENNSHFVNCQQRLKFINDERNERGRLLANLTKKPVILSKQPRSRAEIEKDLMEIRTKKAKQAFARKAKEIQSQQEAFFSQQESQG